MFQQTTPIPYQTVELDDKIQLTVKRIDLVDSNISGNKFFKLKYNLIQAKQIGFKQLLSFGGAYSNHIFALANAAKQYEFRSIGIIRGQELAQQKLNPFLQHAQSCGMQLQFISRSDYRQKDDQNFIEQLKIKYPDTYIIPEGGTNHLAIQGCEEILSINDKKDFDIICCAVGTGGTISGIINSSSHQQKIIGFAALKGDFLTNEVGKWAKQNNWSIYSDELFGGYGKYNEELVNFIQNIQQQYHLPLEPIYTGKAFYYLHKMIQENYFPVSSRILFIHTGGLQHI